MGFTKEVLDYARWLTAKRYPSDAGSIDAGCMVDAIHRFHLLHKPTLTIN